MTGIELFTKSSNTSNTAVRQVKLTICAISPADLQRLPGKCSTPRDDLVIAIIGVVVEGVFSQDELYKSAILVQYVSRGPTGLTKKGAPPKN